LIWVVPPSPLKAAAFSTVRYYMLPLGLWQNWAMFAPDPMRQSITLDADVVDARGLRATYAFPRVAELPKLRAVPRFRHSKYVTNLADPEAKVDREIAARHAVRQLDIPAHAFPVEVTLVYQLRHAPAPGGPPADPMTPPQPMTIGTFQFASLEEVRR
jgi:hypothetical protein